MLVVVVVVLKGEELKVAEHATKDEGVWLLVSFALNRV